MRGWHVTLTRGVTGRWVAWATETRPPEGTTIQDMVLYHPGEVRFAIGQTVEEARNRLEADLPERVP